MSASSLRFGDPGTSNSRSGSSGPHPPGNHRLGPAARAGALATAVLILDTALWVLHLAVRPPCPENYVRLLDVAAVVTYVTGFLAVAAAGVWTTGRKNPSDRLGIAGWFGIGYSLIGVLLLVLALAVLGSDGGTVSHNCWTF